MLHTHAHGDLWCMSDNAGRTVMIRLSRSGDYSLLLELAVEAAFDWVYFAADDLIRLSVIPTSMLIFIVLANYGYTAMSTIILNS